MDNTTLLDLLEAEREMLTANLGKERTPEAAQTQVTRTLERVSMRYAEQCGDAATRDAARLIVQTLISAVPFIDSIGETRRWNRQAGAAAQKKGFKPLALGLLAVAAVLELAVLFALSLSGKGFGLLILIEVLLPGLLALGAAFWAGQVNAKPEAPKDGEADVREEFLVDPERVWRHLRGMVLLADSALERVRAEAEAQRQSAAQTQAAGPLDRQTLELFVNLLEGAYAMQGPEAREMIEGIRFYLHSAGVEAVDCEPGRESWFEFLPADRPGTLRPALAQGEKLLRKGLAAR